MASLLADLRYAFRQLWKNPTFTAIAVAALALGLAVNIAIFTVVNTVMLSPLPYPHADRIVQLGRKFDRGVGYSISVPKYFAWRSNQAFEAAAVYDFGALGMNLGISNPPDQIKATHVSAEYFKVLGFAPEVGRSFSSDEDRPKGPAAVVVTYGLWQSHFAGNRSLVGQTIQLNGTSFPVVGILPKSFHPQPEVDVYLPLQADPNSTNQGHFLNVAARLRPTSTLAQAQAQATAAGEQFRQTFPKYMDKGESVIVEPMRDALIRDVRVALLVLSGAVLLVLLIACANVANLLLVRASVRQRELAVRAAVGASRGRVIQQLLTESVLLAGMGGVLGFVMGAWGVRALLALVPGNIPRLTEENGVHAALPLLDWNIVIFSIGIAVLTGLIFGTFPALQASKANVASNLRESSGRSGTGMKHNRIRSVLVVSEVALALVLLVGAGLLIRTFIGLQNANSGLDPRNVLTVQTSLAGGNYATSAKVTALSEQASRRIEALPGVEAAASSIVLPVEAGIDLPFSIAGKPPARGDYEGDEQWRSVSPHYFQVFKIALLRGRAFRDADSANTSHVVIINEAMAKRYWKDKDPLGQVILIGKGLGPDFEEPAREIVGIVASVREDGLQNTDVGVMYIPQSQVTEGLTKLANSVIPLSWAIRTNANPMAMRIPVEQALRATDGQLPISRERTMETVIAKSVARQDFNMLLLTIFATIALILAAIGIYGLMSYTVEQRSQEFGIRMALGATAAQIRSMMLLHGARLAMIGVAVGLALAYAMTRLLSSLLFGVKAVDPLVFAAVAVVLATIAVFATLIPAARATVVDPVTALRSQ
jgi:putative ABC transport system permease protein